MRTIINELRNPMGIKSKIGQFIFFGILTIILYERTASSLDSYIQNIRGILFFMTMNIVFSSIFGSVNIFSQERGVFIRERLSNTYQTSSYFIGRSFAYVPLEMFLPVLLVTISYFAVPLDHSGQNYLLTIAASWLGVWMASAYGLLLSTAFADAEIALSLVPILIIPLMLVGGFFSIGSSTPDFFRIFEYISTFKYLYQAFVYAQFFNKSDGFSLTLNGTDFQFKGDILAKGNRLYFEEPFWLSMMLMGVIGLAIRALSLLALNKISNPKTLKLLPPL